MKQELKNNFTYLKNKEDYAVSFQKLVSILNKHLGELNNYDQISDTYSECLVPRIYYLGIDKIAAHDANNLRSLLYSVASDAGLENKEEFWKADEALPGVFNRIIQELREIDKEYKYLKYYNETGREIRDRKCFHKNVKLFLEDTGIWKREGEDDYYDDQYEWDIEYNVILNIAYHCNSLEEVNEVYKLVWLYYVGTVVKRMQVGNDKGIDPEAIHIWEKLERWRTMMDDCRES
jgi:hypothetical protein